MTKRLYVTLDDQDHEAFLTWARVHWPFFPAAAVARCLILQRIGGSEPLEGADVHQSTSNQQLEGADVHQSTSNQPLEGAASGSKRLVVPGPLPAPKILLPDPDHREEKKDPEEEQDIGGGCKGEPGFALTSDPVNHLAASRRAGKRLVERINALRGTKYATKGESFAAVCRAVAYLLDHEHHTEADLLSVVEDRWRVWGGTDMARNVNPTTLTRRGNFGRYLAEVGQPTQATPAPRGRRMVGEEANVQQLLTEREKSPEQKELEWQDYCRRLGVHA